MWQRAPARVKKSKVRGRFEISLFHMTGVGIEMMEDLRVCRIVVYGSIIHEIMHGPIRKGHLIASRITKSIRRDLL